MSLYVLQTCNARGGAVFWIFLKDPENDII